MRSIYELEVAQLLKENGVKFKEEYRFCKRRWRFDFCLLPLKVKIAIEVNGSVWQKGKHTYGTQYEKDLEKINTAQLMGWIVLQYVPDSMPKVLDDLKIIGVIK